MVAASPSLLGDFPFPVPLAQLLHFALADPFAQSLADSACNTFFEPALHSREAGAGDGERCVRVRKGEHGCWDLLPEEWRAWFEGIERDEERDQVLKGLAEGERTNFPPTLQAFLTTCRALSLDRTCSNTPLLSYPPQRASPAPRARSPARPTSSLAERHEHVAAALGKKEKNAIKAGMSPKKEHEVVRFCGLVEEMTREEKGGGYCVDVGSGRAHLSRALASPPLNLHVLALDWSSSQKSGAERLDLIRANAALSPTEGSLTHRVSRLDAQGVWEVLREWPPVEEGERTEPPLLVALHACGDLTPDAINAFIRFSRECRSSPATAPPRAVFVGCCYNLQTPSRFPLSRHVSALLSTLPSPPAASPPFTLSHLRLTPQSPPTWHLTPAATASFTRSTLKLAFRARFEAELEAAGLGTTGERRVGRLPECRTWDEYRAKAVGKFDCGGREVRPLSFGETGRAAAAAAAAAAAMTEWETALFRLRVFWTLRSWLGPVLESLAVLDRWACLVEGLLGEGHERETSSRRVELVNLFDQGLSGSLRNLALVVR
ncbi:hypothetical protein JCM21900_005820 [Sporobolomyces salmonicolor]